MQPTRFVWDHFDIALRKEPCFFVVFLLVFVKQPAVSNQAREHAAVEDALIIVSCRVFFFKEF